jgi:hypothetical protein
VGITGPGDLRRVGDFRVMFYLYHGGWDAGVLPPIFSGLTTGPRKHYCSGFRYAPSLNPFVAPLVQGKENPLGQAIYPYREVQVLKPLPVDGDGNPIPRKYDPASFIVVPVDTRGVSYRLTFRVAPDMERALDQVVASNRFPFTTRGDVLRWCVREGIRTLEGMEPVVSVSKRLYMMNTVLSEESGHAEFMHIFTHLEETVAKYLSDQAPDQAVRIIALAKHHFESMPEGYWRDRYLQELEKKFSHLATGKSASFHPGNGHFL